MTKVLMVAESLALAAKINAQQNQCFYNAFNGQIVYKDALYTQGFFAYSPSSIIKHGWLEIDEKVIDPTIVLIRDANELSSVKYFAAEHFTKTEIHRVIDLCKKNKKEFCLPIHQDEPIKPSQILTDEEYLESVLGGKNYLLAHNAALQSLKNNTTHPK